MREIYTFLVICILALAIAKCGNYDRAIQGIEKGKEFIGNAEKKVTETLEGAEKSIGKLLGKETAKSDEKKSAGKDYKNKEKVKD